METILDWDVKVREEFHAKQCALVEALYKLEEAGFRDNGPGFSYIEGGQDIYLDFNDIAVLEASLPKLAKLFGNYKVEQIWNGYGDLMSVSYSFPNKPSGIGIWFSSSVENFPIDKYSPGCKIIKRAQGETYAVECPLKTEA